MRQILEDQSAVVVTHDTESIVDTGRYLKYALGDLPLPVVLTGAMRAPSWNGSDGLQNLTEALFAARTLPYGVYVVMHGTAFPVDRVALDRNLGRFVWAEGVRTRF